MAYGELKEKVIPIWDDPSSSWGWNVRLHLTYRQDEQTGLTEVNIQKFVFNKPKHTNDYVTSSDSKFGVRYGTVENVNTNRFNNQNRNAYDIPCALTFVHKCDDDGNVVVPLEVIAKVTSSSNHVPKFDWTVFNIELDKLPALSKTWIKKNGVWKKAKVWIKKNGIWKPAKVWIKKNGSWKN